MKPQRHIKSATYKEITKKQFEGVENQKTGERCI